MSKKTLAIAVLAGDGIGPEVMEQAIRVVDAAGRIAFPSRPRRRWDDQVALTA